MAHDSSHDEIDLAVLRTRLESLRHFVCEEFALQRNEFYRRWSLPLEERVKEGGCIRKLRFLRKTIDGHLLLACTENETDFREGDFLRLHTGDPSSPLTDCTLVEEGDGFVLVDPFTSHFKLECVDLILDASFYDLESVVLQGIDELGATNRGKERILPLLLEERVEDEFSQDAYDKAWEESEATDHNVSQCDAIAAGAAAQWCTLIQGPPGSGKTRVLANIVAQRLERGERILITAFTHRAIHQALRMIKQLLPNEERIVKVGGIIPDPDLPVQQYESFFDSPLAREVGGYVVGATVFATRTKRLRGIEFNSVVIDEASQMTLPYAVLAMLSSDCYVIIGDRQQLPPVLQSCAPTKAHEQSVFSTLNRKGDLVMLDTTYRMNASITEWASEQFYNGLLGAYPAAGSRRLQIGDMSESAWMRDAVSPSFPLVWLEYNSKRCRHVSMEEVDLIHQLVSELIRSGVPCTEIAVLTPFRKQARAIRRRLKQSTNNTLGLDRLVVVDTVERMQGQEREVVLISCAASEPGFVRSVADFLFLPARLNVSVTRARTKVIVLSHQELLRINHADSDLDEALGVWQSLKASCHMITV